MYTKGTSQKMVLEDTAVEASLPTTPDDFDTLFSFSAVILDGKLSNRMCIILFPVHFLERRRRDEIVQQVVPTFSCKASPIHLGMPLFPPSI